MNQCRLKPECFDIEATLGIDQCTTLPVRHFHQGEILYYEGNIRLLIFKKGKAKACFYEHGESFTLYYLNAHNLYLLDEHTVVEFFQESEVYLLEATDFTPHFVNPDFTNVVLHSLAMSLEMERSIIKNLVFNDCKRRVVTFFVEMAKTAGIQKKGGIQIDLAMSIAEFADFIATKRQTISMILHELVQEGYLTRISARQYLIKDLDALEAFYLE